MSEQMDLLGGRRWRATWRQADTGLEAVVMVYAPTEDDARRLAGDVFEQTYSRKPAPLGFALVELVASGRQKGSG